MCAGGKDPSSGIGSADHLYSAGYLGSALAGPVRGTALETGQDATRQEVPCGVKVAPSKGPRLLGMCCGLGRSQGYGLRGQGRTGLRTEGVSGRGDGRRAGVCVPAE